MKHSKDIEINQINLNLLVTTRKDNNNIMPGKISLFVPGPTNMPDRVRQAMDISNEDHRAPGMEILASSN